jgi:hypothetical protein
LKHEKRTGDIYVNNETRWKDKQNSSPYFGVGFSKFSCTVSSRKGQMIILTTYFTKSQNGSSKSALYPDVYNSIHWWLFY